jgi:uncharacterized membrane protein YphA (DoxX/SURF4 family)
MSVVAEVAGVLLAVVFVRAGVAKLTRPAPTAAAFAAMSLPAPAVLARAVPVVELALAVALVASPAVGGAAALALLALFSAVLVRHVGTETGCGCFGAAHARAVSRSDLLRNAVLAALAFVAIGASAL